MSDPTPYVSAYDLIEANGRTWRENNMELAHNIRVGALVEVKYEHWHGNGACEKVHARLFVTHHRRDCDGSPLYSLAPKRLDDWYLPPGTPSDSLMARVLNREEHGFSEQSLTPVEVTPELLAGEGALGWRQT